MHGDLGVIQKIDNQNKSIHTVVGQSWIKINKPYYYRCKTQQNMLVHGFFDHGKQHFFHKRKSKWKNHKGALTKKLTLKSQMLS
jgi:hypothetical protein